jgi:SAM-dependent methyltransferase
MYREEIINHYVGAKDVLDCGGVDHWAFRLKADRGDWLHSLVTQRARTCVGVDILVENIRSLRNLGDYIFVAANAEDLPFQNCFDVVLAGELVEHLDNMGRFCHSAWNALREDGVLIVTTPNNWAISKVLRALIVGRECCHPEHTCWYSPQTLRYILEQHCFTVEVCRVVARPARYGPINWLYTALAAVRPLLAETLVIVARKAGGQNRKVKKW